MVEYIEREAVLKLFDKVGCYLNPKCLERQKEQIEQLPNADVVKVVRCKDCKNYTVWKQASVKWKGKALGCSKFQRKTLPTDFCSCGELKECEG